MGTVSGEMSCVRIASILRRLDPANDGPAAAATPFETAEELALARKLVAFPGAVDQAVTTLRPHFISSFLFELAGAFSSFYNANRVLVDDEATRARRLLLCRRTLLIMRSGLQLLTIRALDEM